MRKLWIILLTSLFIAGIISFFTYTSPSLPQLTPTYGFSFSPHYASYLGVDPQEAYIALLDELRPATVRLPIYWSETEVERGVFDFSKPDWYIEQAYEKDIPVVLAFGYRTFRYPECYPPEWVENLPNKDFEDRLLSYVGVVADHYSSGDIGRAVEAFQVENEPLDVTHPWCRRFTRELVEKEITLVKSIDTFDRPIIFTMGGEAAFYRYWSYMAKRSDFVGVSFYPRAFHPILKGYVDTYKLGKFSPRDIVKERSIAEDLGKDFWVVELQAEPWGARPITTLTQKEIEQTMSVEKLKENIELLESFGGAARIYLWGAEWWYYMREVRGDSSLLDEVKKLWN